MTTCSDFPSEATSWMNEIEMVDSLDEIRSSRSIAGKNFPNFEMLDARIASAVNKIIQNSHFKEQKAQKEDRFLRGRQTAFMIYVIGAHGTVLDYADLFSVTSTGQSVAQLKKTRQKYDCIDEADESMRKRIEGSPHKNHEDHIAGKGMNSLSRYNLVHKFIPMLQAMKMPDAKAAVEKEWEKLEEIPAWQLTKVKNENEVIAEARNEGRNVHFASSMDLCHLKNSELEPQFQQYKG